MQVASGSIFACTVLPDGRRAVIASGDHTVRLYDVKEDATITTMKGHRAEVRAVAASPGGQGIVSGDDDGNLISWKLEGDACQLTHVIGAHSKQILSLDFSPDGAVLATSSMDGALKLWSTKTWQPQGNPMTCDHSIICIRYSPDGTLLAAATSKGIQVWRPSSSQWIANFMASHVITKELVAQPTSNASLEWMPDGRRLFTGGSQFDPTLREWDALTWKQVDGPWEGHTSQINGIAINSAATTVASASHDHHVHLWRHADRQTIAIFKLWDVACFVTFSGADEYILSGGKDRRVWKWTVPRWQDTTLLEQSANTQASKVDTLRVARPENTSDWDHALYDALKSVETQPSLSGYISMGIALCGQQRLQDAMKAIDLAFMFTEQDPKVTHRLLLIKASLVFVASSLPPYRTQAILYFNADQRPHAMLRIQELAAACPNADTLACDVVEAYLRVQMGISALDGGRHTEAAESFAAAVNTGRVWSKLDIHSEYKDFVMLFGWDLKFLWRTTHQKQCDALLLAGRPEEALKSYQQCHPGCNSYPHFHPAFKRDCGTLCIDDGDAALSAGYHDLAIDLYSVAIELDPTNDAVFANRGLAKLGEALWEEALLDAQKAIDLNPSNYHGHKSKHSALHGAQRYDEAIQAFEAMLFSIDSTTEAPRQRNHCLSLSQAEGAIQEVIHAQLNDSPPRLLNTCTGRLCDREGLIEDFKASPQYKELLSLAVGHGDNHRPIKEAVAKYFHRVMLSHRWEEKELLLSDVWEKAIFKLNSVGAILKLQSFCKTAGDAGYRWGWVDTCCIDQKNSSEVQTSINSMFSWYSTSALTIVYLSDVPPLSESGALAKSAWNQRGWTVPEFLASKVVLFHQNNWSLYLDKNSSNHKECDVIMQELGDATGIDGQALVAFHPGMRGARQKLQWVSTRITTVPEDGAYSLFGIFGIHLPIIYGENKQNALGRLLQEIVARSGDITTLHWVGKSSEFNSCLPADITSYKAPPYMPPSLSEDEVQTSISSWLNALPIDSVSRLYTELDMLRAPHFANCKLHLPCIVFPLTEVKKKYTQDSQNTYDVKAAKLNDLVITTENKLSRFSPMKPLKTGQGLILARPWNRSLLGLSGAPDDAQSLGSWSDHGSSLQDSIHNFSGAPEVVDKDPCLQALQLIVRLGQPFSAILLERQPNGEYKRTASDQNIVAKLIDPASSIQTKMDIRYLDIL
ncbi:hypothetical protein BDR05DRAFT_1004670 [Suillus weaverae]|nr:hypothetical protein BDR05DRAFT_1004670 [Suillus weaverae]